MISGILSMIALMTDFGTQDTYVGVMKGVISGIDPTTRLIDITHAIQPQNVKQAAFALQNAYRYFPVGTVFLIVIDPGVGSVRKPIAVQAGGYTFIAPDNGVLSYALAEIKARTGDVPDAVVLNNRKYHLNVVSNTFHGRDIFAPAAAHIHAGVPLKALGQQVNRLQALALPDLTIADARIEGEVIHIDHFGNVVTSIGRFAWQGTDELSLTSVITPQQKLSLKTTAINIHISGHQFRSVQANYATVTHDNPLVLIGSDGYLELAVNQGNAAKRYDIAIGDKVIVIW